MNKTAIFRNKYVLTLIALLVWVIFFDKNDFSSQYKIRKDVKQLEEEKRYFIKEIAEIKDDLKELTSNPKTLEKFAREKYLMKRDNEDIFVIVYEPKRDLVDE